MSPIGAGLLAVLLSTILSDALAPFPAFAFFSHPERMQGGVFFIHVVALAAMAAALFRDRKAERIVVGAHAIASALVGVIAVVSFASYQLGDHPETRIFSTLGNNVFLGQYAALAFCLCFYGRANEGPVVGRFYIAAAALNLFSVFASQSRGAILATLAAIIILARGAGWRGRRIAIGAVALLTLAPLALTHTHSIWDTLRQSAATEARLAMWPMAVQDIIERPFFGWGNGGFLLGRGRDFPADYAHNFALDWLLQGGVLGFAAWAALFWALAASIRRSTTGGERDALWAFLAAYFVADFFLFDTIPTCVLLATVLGIGASKQRVTIPSASSADCGNLPCFLRIGRWLGWSTSPPNSPAIPASERTAP